MRRSDSIFDSKAEREVYGSLESRFGDAGRLVPQLPLTKIVAFDEIDRAKLSGREFSFLLKTNVDYTFCDQHDRPLLSVEFDGIGGGYSRNGTYIPERLTSDPKRVWKLDFKLRLARKIGYPLLIVSFDETQGLGEGESLTILDGIVGYFLSRQHTRRLIDEHLEGLDLDGIPEVQHDELVQDLILGAEVEAELTYDPLARAAAKLEHEVGGTHSGKWFYDPPVPELPSIFSGDPREWPTAEQLVDRLRRTQSANRVGARVEVWSESAGITREHPITETVWIRNIGSEFGTITMIAENIATYLALTQLHRALNTAAQAA